MLGHPLLRVIAATTGLGNFFTAMLMATQTIFLVRVIGLQPVAVGLMLSASAVGGLVGALSAGTLAGRLGQARIIWLSALATGPFALLWPLSGRGATAALFAIGSGVVSFGAVVYNVAQVSFRQTLCPPRLLGRMNATLRFLVWGTLPLGAVVGGAVAGTFDPRAALWVCATGFLVVPLPLLLSPCAACAICRPLRTTHKTRKVRPCATPAPGPSPSPSADSKPPFQLRPACRSFIAAVPTERHGAASDARPWQTRQRGQRGQRAPQHHGPVHGSLPTHRRRQQGNRSAARHRSSAAFRPGALLDPSGRPDIVPMFFAFPAAPWIRYGCELPRTSWPPGTRCCAPTRRCSAAPPCFAWRSRTYRWNASFARQARTRPPPCAEP